MPGRTQAAGRGRYKAAAAAVNGPRSTPDTRTQFRHPRVAQVVAAALRDRILVGDLPDGGTLPKQDELLEQFGVSLPSLREALSILETEGLVTVQRGNIGGSVVHHPTPAQPSYMAALVMQAQSVTLDDLVTALRRLDPLCAALCAERSDRRRTVVPKLRQNIKLAETLLDKPEQSVLVARHFHEELVAGCGNQSLILMVGALDSIWAAHDEIAIRAAKLGPFTERRARERALAEHERILEGIIAGDARAAETAAREHYHGTPVHALLGHDLVVDAGLLRDQAFSPRQPKRPMSHAHLSSAV